MWWSPSSFIGSSSDGVTDSVGQCSCTYNYIAAGHRSRRAARAAVRGAARGSGHLEHDLAERPAALDQPQRLRRVLERVARADDRRHEALLGQREHALADLAVDLRLGQDVGAPAGADDLRVVE